MSSYGISAVAERTGFSPSTLRYYEQIGLVGPSERTGSGYRRYDDRAVDRLRFVARSKRLGLDLTEIKDLVALWDADECAPVQQRLRELLLAKQTEATTQIRALEEFHHELTRVADRLGMPAVAGACGNHCACVDEQVAGPSPSRNPIPVTAEIVCALEPAEVPDRATAWAELASHVVEREPTVDGVRLRFDTAVTAATLAALAAEEVGCCAFFSFTLRLTAGGPELEIAAPAEARVLIDALVPAAR
jgi:DNA-binding transcriptional MerR regulator